MPPKHTITRRAALTGAAATGLAALGAPVARAQAPAVLGTTRLPVSGYFRRPPYLVAVHKGFFAKERLEIDYHVVEFAPDHNRELAEGKWPLTLSSADTMLARTTQDNVDFVMVMQTEEGLDVQLVAQPQYKSLQELRGKLFAADPIDSNYDLVRNKIMRDHGLNEKDYRIDVLGPSRVRANAFTQGKVDAAMLAPPWNERAIAAGGKVLAEGADYIPNWPLSCGWGLRRWIEGNRSTVVRFVRAMAQASDWLLKPENREETIALMMREEKLARNRAENSYRRVVPNSMISPEAIRRNIEVRIELGYYKPPHKPTEAFYDLSYWSEATGEPVPPAVGLARNAVAG
jgi:ABC-type nitrate/sulfonate/bicarbonate transport system substrate-binding protein